MKTLIVNISPASNHAILTKNSENSKQLFMMVTNGSHQWIRLKIMMMLVDEMVHKIWIFDEKLSNNQFYNINYIS